MNFNVNFNVNFSVLRNKYIVHPLVKTKKTLSSLYSNVLENFLSPFIFIIRGVYLVMHKQLD